MRLLITSILIFYSTFIYSQIKSGEYESELKIAYNPDSKIITGYFANYSGYDESTNNPRFSCIFYIYGFFTGKESIIDTYYPLDDNDTIKGVLKINNSDLISIKLPEEHGGCWNVFHFADGFADFKIVKEINWLEIRYINVDKSYFYNDTNANSQRKAYLIKGDIIYIEKIKGEWVYCKYFGKSITEGWMKKETINN